MNKVLKIISKVALSLSVVLLCFSMIMPNLTDDAIDSLYLVAMLTNTLIPVCAIVGAVLTSAANDTARKIGHGMTVSAFVAGVVNALMFVGVEGAPTQDPGNLAIETETSAETSVAAIFMIIAAVILAVHYVLLFIAKLLNKSTCETENPNEDPRIVRIREWKKVLDEGIITEEEFEEKRMQLLGLKPKQK